uniref:Cell division protein FTSH n=1 Tax=Pseudobryopsis hainanensis TaxID=2320808 RepID=A0A3S7SXL9_9CHLO|nr:Cell division protein FTSH [Pseudobryopsis hainanensis]
MAMIFRNFNSVEIFIPIAWTSGPTITNFKTSNFLNSRILNARECTAKPCRIVRRKIKSMNSNFPEPKFTNPFNLIYHVKPVENKVQNQFCEWPTSCIGEHTFLQIYFFILKCSAKFKTTFQAIENESKQPAIISAWLLLVLGVFNVDRPGIKLKGWSRTPPSFFLERQESPPRLTARAYPRIQTGSTISSLGEPDSSVKSPPCRLATIYMCEAEMDYPGIGLENNFGDFIPDDRAPQVNEGQQYLEAEIMISGLDGPGLEEARLEIGGSIGIRFLDYSMIQRNDQGLLRLKEAKPSFYSPQTLEELTMPTSPLVGRAIPCYSWDAHALLTTWADSQSNGRLGNCQAFNKSFDKFGVSSLSPSVAPKTKPLIRQHQTSQIYRKYRSDYRQFEESNNWFFSEQREVIHAQSYLLFFQWAVGLAIFRIFQALYSEHGKEILIFLVDSLVLLGIIQDEEWLKIELGLNPHRDFREVHRVNKQFKDLAGVPRWAVGAGEMVWFLRAGNQLRQLGFLPFFQSHRSLKTFLLFGPPGTGKTFLVQSLAGEAEVPILIQAGGVLKNPKQRGYGARAIQNLFRRARKIAPCIVFIDEVDGVGAKRENFTARASEQIDPIQIVDTWSGEPVLANFSDWHLEAPPLPSHQSLDQEQDLDAFQLGEFLPDRSFYNPAALKVLQENQWENLARAEQLSVLTQLLIELDGLKPLNNLVVVGATNRPGALDPALLRPGRFNQSIELRLPNFQKRVELFRLYTRPFQTLIPTIPWAYLARRTDGSSAADIAAIANQVALKVAYRGCSNPVNIFDESVDAIFSHPDPGSNRKCAVKNMSVRICLSAEAERLGEFSQPAVFNPNSFSSADFSLHPCSDILRIAYYAVGKNFVSSRLCKKVPYALIRVFERPKNFRARLWTLPGDEIHTRLRRYDLELDLISLFSGHAGQAMGLGLPLNFARYLIRPCGRYTLWNLDQSNVGWADAQRGSRLIQQMILQWYFYAHQIATEKLHSMLMSSNSNELGQEQSRLLEALGDNLNQEIYLMNPPRAHRQRWSFRAWWQKTTSNLLSISDRGILEWYRIYLGDPEETERNIEWVPPDDYYHQSTFDRLETTRWNSFLRINCEYLYRGLVFGALDVAWVHLRSNCECVDVLVDALLRFESMRDTQFHMILKNLTRPLLQTQLGVDSVSKERVVVPSWGPRSRRAHGKKVQVHLSETS